MPYISCFTIDTMPPADGSGPPLPEPSEFLYMQFYSALGSAVSSWQLVENHWVAIYYAVIEAKNFGAAASAFMANVNAKAKLDMLNAAVLQSRLTPARKAEWKHLTDRISTCSKSRNIMAHGTVYFAPMRDIEDERLLLGPLATNPARSLPDVYAKSS